MSTLFVSHGAPNLILHSSEARHFLEKFGKNLGKPRAILIVRGFDHGTWVPLVLMHPEADIPVVQLSVELDKGAAYHLKLGRALKPLAESGVLIIGSGAATHNLHKFFRGQYRPDSPAPD